MNRIDRLAAIVKQLQSMRLVKAQDVTNKFSVILRIVYRDMKIVSDNQNQITAVNCVSCSSKS